MNKYNSQEIIYEEAFKLFYEKASDNNIKLNQNILNEFVDGLNILIENLNSKEQLDIIGKYIYNIIHKYNQTQNKIA